MRLRAWSGLLAIACFPCVFAPAEAPNPDEARPKHVLKLPNVLVDLDRRRIVIDAEVCRPDYALEFLLCRTRTKEYESLLRTQARAADLHAGLLALGLLPGKPARWKGRGEKAEFLPPQGPIAQIALRWKDLQGEHQMDAGRWLANPKGKSKPAPQAWVFVGSTVLPDGRYLADLPEEGGIISVANLASATMDVPFESTQALASREFVADWQAVPQRGTKVEVVISPVRDAEKADHARVLLDIDDLGRRRLLGREVHRGELAEWARGFIADHKYGQVIVRARARAYVEDLRQTRKALESAGIEDIEIICLPPHVPLLPRTNEQAKELIETWRQRLGDPQRLLFDPVRRAEETLTSLDTRRQRVKSILALWQEYAAHLRETLRRYKASTQPAKGASKPQSRGG